MWKRPRVRRFVPASRFTHLVYSTSGAISFGGSFNIISSISRKFHRAGCFVHSPWWPGERIAELTTAHNIDRSWERMGPGNAALHIARNDPAIDSDVLQRGNKLAIASDDMPDWVGTIVTLEESLRSGEIEIQALGEAAVLDGRVLPQGETFTGGSDGAFRRIIDSPNARSHTGIFRTGVVGLGPPVMDFPLGGQSGMQGLNRLHEDTNWEWWIESEATPTHIRSQIQWGYRQGEDLAESCHLYQGVHFGDLQYKLDLSHVKDVVVATGSFGAPLSERNSVARMGSEGPQRVDIGTSVLEAENTAASRSVADLPPGLRNERHLFEVMTDSVAELSRRAQRAFERPFASGELFTVHANRLADWQTFRIGNFITLHASLGLGDIDRKIRIVGMQPSEEDGICELVCEVPPR